MIYKTFAHKQLVRLCLLIPTTFFILSSIIILIVQPDEFMLFLIPVVILSLIQFFMLYAMYYKAFKIIYMDEKRIKYGEIDIEWKEITKIETKEVKLFQYSGFKPLYLDSWICIKKTDNQKIFISMCDEHMKKMKLFGEAKSQVLRENENFRIMDNA